MKCEDPGIPNYGYRIRDDGHFTDTVVLYSCNPGYAMHGSSTLTCLSGDRRVWDKPMPSCVGESGKLGQIPFKGQAKGFMLQVTLSWERAGILLLSYCVSMYGDCIPTVDIAGSTSLLRSQHQTEAQVPSQFTLGTKFMRLTYKTVYEVLSSAVGWMALKQQPPWKLCTQNAWQLPRGL